MFLYLALAVGLRSSQFAITSFSPMHSLHFFLLGILTSLSYFSFFLILIHSIFSWLNLPSAIGGKPYARKFLGIKTGLILGMSILLLSTQVALISITSHSLLEILLTCQIVIFSVLHVIFFAVWVYVSKKFQMSLREISLTSQNSRSEILIQTYLLIGVTIIQMLLWSATERSTLLEQAINQELIYWIIYVVIDIFSFGMVIFIAFSLERFYFGNPQNERSPLIENDIVVIPDAPGESSVNKEEVKPKRGLKKKICLVIVILILLTLGLCVFFMYPRYPSWEIQSMDFNKFKINSDFTAAVSLDVNSEISDNLGTCGYYKQSFCKSSSYQRHILSRLEGILIGNSIFS